MAQSMIRIGDFARVGGVSVATLRHYDDEGILLPCSVNPDSGYRYYRAKQLRDLHRIQALKGLGFSLAEIKSLKTEQYDAAEMRTLLAKKQQEAESRLADELAHIHRIEHHIRIIEWRQTMPNLEVIQMTAPAMTVAAIRVNIPNNNQVGDLLGQAYGQLCAGLSHAGLAMKGPAMAFWHSTPDMLQDEIVDAAFPVEAIAIDDPAIGIVSIPETEVASVTHVGPFSEFQQCHVVLSEWLAANGYRLEGAYREIYHSCPPDEAKTEVQYPIVKEG